MGDNFEKKRHNNFGVFCRTEICFPFFALRLNLSNYF